MLNVNMPNLENIHLELRIGLMTEVPIDSQTLNSLSTYNITAYKLMITFLPQVMQITNKMKIIVDSMVACDNMTNMN